MRKFLLLLAATLLSCSGVNEQPTLLRGQLVLEVLPNPIPVARIGDDLYEFRFSIIMREEGGVDVRIENFTVEAVAFKTVVVRKETLGADAITRRGYPATVPAGEFLKFDFVRRWNVPTRWLLAGASARVSVRTVDAHGRKNVTYVRVDTAPVDAPATESGSAVLEEPEMTTSGAPL